MLNMKKYYKDLLSSNTELVTKIGNDKIVSGYPQEVKNFPLVVYEDTNARDTEFVDNFPEGQRAEVRIHIFTKTLKNYPTTYELGDLIHKTMRADLWACTLNQEMSDVEDNIRHRVMDFNRAFFAY